MGTSFTARQVPDRAHRPRRSRVAVVTAALAMALPSIPAAPSHATGGPTPDPGVAIWADATEGRSDVRWSASKSFAFGLVHSNDDLVLSGSKNKLLGGTEYVNRIRLTGQRNTIDPAATKVAAREAPVTFDIADYRPGGAVANAAGADYVDHSAECGAPGQPAVLHLRRDELSRGLHYAPCDVVLTDALSHQPTTIVADGKIKVTGSTSELGPAYVEGLQLFSDSTSKNAIKIAGNWADVDGVVYAPRGQVTVAGEGHEFRCAVVASRVAIKGAKHTFTGDADCGSIPPGNTPPIAIDDTYSVDEDNTLTIVAPGVLSNDTDADGDPLTAVLVDDVANGTLTLVGDGEFTYAPDADFAGDDTFTYVANDGTDDSNTATVTITVNPINDPPVADANGPYSALAGETITFDGSGSFDLDGTIDSYDWDFGDGNTGTGVAPTHSYTEAGTFTVTLTVTDDGGLFDTTTTTAVITDIPNTPPVADANGPYSALAGETITFDGSGSFDLDGTIVSYDWDFGDGSTGTGVAPTHAYTEAGMFTVTLTVTDDGDLTDTTTATAVISEVPNTPPVSVDDDYTVDEDTTLTVAALGVLDNDTDVDGDTLTAALVDDVTNGTLTLSSDGSFIYVPNADFFGDDTFTYLANDGTDDSNTGTVTITVNPVNDPPVAVDDDYTTNEDTTLLVTVLTVLDNDTDAEGDPLTAVLVDDVTNGTLTLNGDGSFTYVPDLDFFGEDTFTYVANDSTDNSNTATATITVNPVNDPPVADANGPYTGVVDTALTFDGAGSFDLDGTIASYEWDFGDGNTGTGTSPDHTYTSAGLFTVTLTVTDDSGLADTTSTTADIAPSPNTPPVATDDEYSTSEDATLTVTVPGVLDNDTDAEGDPLTAALVDDVTNGTLALETDGSFTYVPDADFFGDDTFTYVANDGTDNSNTATVTVTVNPVNDPPVADAGLDQAVTVGDIVTLDGSASSDPGDGDPLGFSWAFETRPAGSIAVLNGTDTVAPMFIPDLPGDFVIELTVDDGNGGVATDSVTITASVMGMTITVEDPLIGAGRSTNGAISLENPAPPGGLTVTLALDTGIATVDPIAVFIPQGASEGTFTVTGVDVGTTTIVGTSPATVTASADIGVTDALISIDDIPVIAPDEVADLPVSITKPAPPGGVTITFESLDPSIAITEPTAFVPEGLYVPVANPQITGVDFGTTQIKATALNYGPDTRDVTVALAVTLTPDVLDVPQLWTRQVTAQLSAPAPAGGVTLDLSLDDPLATVPASVFIAAGQTLSLPIDVTAGPTLGTTTLRAGGPGLVEATATITISQTPDVWLEEGANTYRTPFQIGVDLQIQTRIEFGAPLPGAVDVVVSAPPGSGLLFSASPDTAGSESLVVETDFNTTASIPRTSYFYVQGTIVGDDVDDDIAVTIDVFDTGTTTPTGYEQADMPSNVDVGPSGFSFSTDNDLDTTTLSTDENVDVRSYLLYDGEATPTRVLNRLRNQEVRGGHTVTITPTNTVPTVGQIVSPATLTGGAPRITANAFGAYAVFDPLTPGTTTLGITQPPGHTPPANGYTTRTINVDAPDVWLYATSPSNRISEEEIGRDLQVERRIRLEVAPPAPGLDVTIEVIDPTVALISTDPTATGTASVTFPLVTGVSTPPIYLQGLTVDQATQVRITAPGYDQWITNVQIVDAGFYIWSPGDFTTTVDAGNRSIRVRPATLDALQEVDRAQLVRGGLSLAVDVTSSDPAVGAITVSPLVFTGADDELITQFVPLTVGTTTISISQPTGFLQPSDRGPIVATVEPA